MEDHQPVVRVDRTKAPAAARDAMDFAHHLERLRNVLQHKARIRKVDLRVANRQGVTEGLMDEEPTGGLGTDIGVDLRGQHRAGLDGVQTAFRRQFGQQVRDESRPASDLEHVVRRLQACGAQDTGLHAANGLRLLIEARRLKRGVVQLFEIVGAGAHALMIIP